MNRRSRGNVARLIGAVRRDRAGLLVTTALTTAVLAVVSLPARAQLAADTQPTGGVVVAGSARIGATASTTTITQSSARAAVNWQSFNVGSAATVNFVQPSASAVTLNRVLAADPSVIAGHIHANGGIVITNQSGVVFTHGAEVNAASVLVSAAGITNRNFMAGRMQFDIPAKPGARIVNAGHITVESAGLAALVAPEVANSGVITAKLGHVILAGGAAAETLDLYGDGLVSLDVTPEAHHVRLANGATATALVTNSGTIVASGGTVLLTARQADGLVQDLVDAGGTIAANSVGAHAGTIAITGIGGSIRIPGTLLAEGTAPGTAGGAIALDATGTVTLADGARINASGAAGGGTVAIGTTLARARGGPGTASTLTARAVDVSPQAQIAASATNNGNGGRVTVLSTGQTVMAGTITARGGPDGGNGGSAEISGENLSLTGGVDVTAPLGVTGSILLDPTDLTIVDSGANDSDVPASALNGVAFTAGGANDTVSASVINHLGGNVTLQATNDLEIAASISLGPGQSLTLQAGNNLTIDAKDPATSSAVVVSAPDNVSLNAGTGGIIINGSLSGGDVTLATTGSAFDSLGAISATTLSGTTGNGASLTGANNSIGTLADFDSHAGGTFNLADKSPLVVTGNVSVPAGSALEIGANGLTLATGSSLIAPGGNVTLNGGTGSIVIDGFIGGGSGRGSHEAADLALTADGAVLGAGGTLDVTTLSGTSAGASLTNINNNIGTLATYNSSTGTTFNLIDQSPLTVTGNVSVQSGGLLAINADTLAINGGLLSAPGGVVQLAPYTAANAVALIGKGSVGAGTLAITETDLAGVAATVLQIGTPSGGPITINGAITLPPTVTLLDLESGGALSETKGDSLSVGTLAADVQSANLIGNNFIGTLDNFTVTDGPFTLNDQEALDIAGFVSVPSNAATFMINGGGLGESGAGVISAGTLAAIVATGSVVSLMGNNAIGTLDAITASGGFTLTDTEVLNLAGLVGAGGATVQLKDPGFAISELGGSITAGTLTGSGASAAFTDANQVGTLGSFSVSTGGFSFTEAAGQPLAVTGPVSAPTSGEMIALTADALAIGAGALAAPGGTVQLAPSTVTNAVALVGSGSGSAGTLAITEADLGGIIASVLQIGTPGGGPIVIGNPGDTITIPNVTALRLESASGVTEGGGLSVSVLEGTVASAALMASNTISMLGDFTAANGAFTLNDKPALDIVGAVSAVGNLATFMINGGGLSESGSGAINAGTLAASVAAGSAIDLIGNNDIGTLAGVSAPDGFTFNDPDGFIIAGNVTAGPFSGTVALTSNGAVTEQGGTISAFLLTGTVGSATLGGNNFISEIGGLTAHGGLSLTDERVFDPLFPSFGTLAIAGPVDIGGGQANFNVPNGNLAESGFGVLTAGTLSGRAFNVSLSSASNPIGTLGAFAAPGGFTLATAGGLSIADVVNTTGAVIDLLAGGSITELPGSSSTNLAGGTLVGGELLGFAGRGALTGAPGTASFTNTNTLTALGAFTALGGFTLADASNLDLLGPLNAGSGTVQLNDPGFAIVESGGSITAATLSGTLAFAALGGANSIIDLGNFSATGGFSLTNLGALTLTGLVTAGSAEAAFTVIGGSLGQTHTAILTAGTLAGSASQIELADQTNQITSLGAITAPGGLILGTANGLGITGAVATGAAPVSLVAGGNIAEFAGGALDAGALTGSASAASFANTNRIAELGSFTAPGGFTLDNAGNLPIAGPLDAGASTALLIAGGSLTETRATILGQTTAGSITAGTLTGSAGSVTLDGGGTNLVANLGSFTAAAFTFNDGENLAVIGTVTGNPIGLDVNGNLALGNPALGGGAGRGVLAGTGAVFLVAAGAVTEPAGAIDASILTGSAASVSLPGANLVPLLGAYTTSGPFLLNAAEPTLTVDGPLSAGSASLAAAGNLVLAGPVSANAVTLSAGGAITEAGGVISAGALAGSATDATLTGANTIGTLGGFATPGSILLTDESPLAVAGPVSAAFFGITDPSGVSFTGATDVGTLSIAAGGSITEPSGTVTAALLEGSAKGLAQLGPDAPAGSASITTLGPFSVSSGTFTLTDSVPLAITGPLSANDFAITAPGSIVITNTTITTIGLPAAQQSAALPSRPGSYFDVTTPGGRFLQLGRTMINPLGGLATVRIQLNLAGGMISFADLVAPTTDLILDTGAGTAVGTIDIGALMVLGNLGSATLTGMVADLSGLLASSKATISPFQSARYRLNSCPLMSVNCIFLAPMSVPQGNPLSGLAIVSAPPNQQDTDLLLPNVAAEDY